MDYFCEKIKMEYWLISELPKDVEWQEIPDGIEPSYIDESCGDYIYVPFVTQYEYSDNAKSAVENLIQKIKTLCELELKYKGGKLLLFTRPLRLYPFRGRFVAETQIATTMKERNIMPLKKVTQNGQVCWKWGDSGHVYCGSDGRSKALKQGRAELENGAKASSFKDRGIIAMEIKEIDEELAQIEAAKMSPPMKQDMKNPIMDVQPGYSSIDGESLVKEDAQVNLMQDSMSDNQDYSPTVDE